MNTWKMFTMSHLLSPVCQNTVRITESCMLHHLSCDYFGSWAVTVTTLTKTTISRSEIIVQRRSLTLSTRFEMLYTTSHLRTLVGGVASIYRGPLQCFGTTVAHHVLWSPLAFCSTYLWPTIRFVFPSWLYLNKGRIFNYNNPKKIFNMA